MRFLRHAFILFSFLAGFATVSGGEYPLFFPGKTHPQPRQLGLDEIDALPVRDVTCPVCGFKIAAPEMDKLVLGADGGAGGNGSWEMHAASRDADLCPYPGPGKVAFQADILVCPSCGYADDAAAFSRTIPPEFRSWVETNLKPNMRAVESRLLGRRGAEMSEAEIVAFFNRQEEIPDRLRTEHARTVKAARRDPKLARAEAAWRAAWACRRALNAPPEGDFLSDKGVAATEQLVKAFKPADGAEERLATLKRLTTKNRSGKQRLNAAETYYARMLLAGVYDRLGLRGEAEAELGSLFVAARERFARPEQDPLWQFTAGKVARAERPQLLENARLEIEQEVSARIADLAAEREYLAQAANLLREALSEGEIAAPDSALFHAYLAAEFLRRTGDLPLAAEWFKAVAGLAPGGSPVKTAAARQLEALAEQAADRVNLLAAVGHDGEVIEKLREICKK